MVGPTANTAELMGNLRNGGGASAETQFQILLSFPLGSPVTVLLSYEGLGRPGSLPWLPTPSLLLLLTCTSSSSLKPQ